MLDDFPGFPIAAAVAALVLVSPAPAQQPTAETPDAEAPPETISTAPRAWEEAWRIELSRGAGVTPVWVDSMVLVASFDRNVHLVRLDPEPEIEWKENFKGGFLAPPVLTDDRIYLAETRRGARLVALSRRTREIEWTADAGDMEAVPLVADTRIYTVSSLGVVKAWTRRSGGEVWETELETRIVADPVLLGDRLVLAASNGTLHALDPGTGEVLESVDAGAGSIWGDPIVRASDDGARRAIFASLEGHVIEVDRDLEIVARRTFPSAFYAGPSTGAGDRLYLSGHDGTVWAYDWDTSEVVWSSEVGSALRMAPAPGGDLIAVGDLGGTLHLLDEASGMVMWTKRLDDAITAPPLVRGSRVWAITEKGTLYAFVPEGDG